MSDVGGGGDSWPDSSDAFFFGRGVKGEGLAAVGVHNTDVVPTSVLLPRHFSCCWWNDDYVRLMMR